MQPSKTQRIVGWILSVLIALMLMGPSAGSKLADWDGRDKEFEKIGFSVGTMKVIGIVEIAIAILYLIPRTNFLGAILISAYLGGAVCAHVRIGDAFIPPIVIGVLMWIGLGLRRPEIFRLAFWPDSKPAAGTTEPKQGIAD